MHWQDILTILVPIMGMIGWVYSRIEKRFEKIENKMEQRFEKMEQRFDQVDLRLQSLDNRLTRLEGRFDERGYWESRSYSKTGTEDTK